MDGKGSIVDIPLDLAVYPISTAGHLTGVAPRQIRSWELYGLLRPARTKGGHRLFSRQDLDLIKTIQQLRKKEGMRLRGIKALFETRFAEDGAKRRGG